MIRGVPLFRSEDRKSKIENPPGRIAYLDPARDDDDDNDDDGGRRDQFLPSVQRPNVRRT